MTTARAGPQALTTLNNGPEGYDIELFREDALLVNITEHVLVPKHRLLTPEEKKALLDR